MEDIKIKDVGNYIEEADHGLHVRAFPQWITTYYGICGKLRWGLAQFGSVGILGYAPVATQAFKSKNVQEV